MSIRSYAILTLIILSSAVVCADTLVNINTADSATLQTLNGIGPSKAQAIIDYRTQNGAFQKIEDIMNVSGIGTATYNNIKGSITIGDTGTSAVSDTQMQSTTTQSTTSTNTSSNTTAPLQPVSSYVPPPVPEIFADGGDDRTVIVGADTQFVGRAYDRQKKVLDHVRFLWNFGDGTSVDGPIVSHHYQYPGRYAVVLTIAEDRYSISDHLVVTAEPAHLSFTTNGDGSVTIGNLAGRDLDLSGWMVRSFGRTFTLPADTLVLSGASLRLSNQTLNFFATNESELDYPNGALALSAGSVVQPGPPPSAKPITVPAPKVVRVEPSIAEAATDSGAEDVATTSQLAAVASAVPQHSYWWLGAIGLAFVAGGGLIAVRRFKKDEWDIIEQTE